MKIINKVTTVLENCVAVVVNEEKGVVAFVPRFRGAAKQIVRCSPEDQFDPEIGVALAICRGLFGSKTQFRKFVRENAKFIERKKPNEQTAAE